MNASFTPFRYEELDAESKALVQASADALRGAYAPYSRFLVGAAILLDDSSIETGSNQENAAYPSGLCAERVALFSVASRFPHKVIKQICVTAKRTPDGAFLPATPCGGCRQVLLEMEFRQKSRIKTIMLWRADEWIVTASAEDLLPYSFSAENL